MNDYIFRPDAFSDYSLYDFLRLTDVKKLTAAMKRVLIVPQSPCAHPNEITNRAEEAEEETYNENEGHSDMPESIPVDDHACYQFKEGHPNCETHAVFKLKNDKSYVLNFVGGTLPRRDKGNREMYCMVMSVLFRPGGWRTGKEIKQEG